MRTANILLLTVMAGLTARADFSYTTRTKSSGGMMGGAMKNQVAKHYFKGNKMRMDRGAAATILDFDAQTVTYLDVSNQTYSLTSFGTLGAQAGEAVNKSGAEVSVDVKETGQRKNINGYNAHEGIMTMDMESPQAQQAGMKMRMEMDLWLSPDVPGAGDMRTFYQRNAARFPWAAMAGPGRGNQGIQKSFGEVQRKMASLNGVPVLQVMRMKTAGNEPKAAQAQEGMTKACTQIEAMKAKGGQQAAMAEQLLTKMNCNSGGAGGGTPGVMLETTLESSAFSASAIPDSIFAVPVQRNYRVRVRIMCS